MPWEIEEGIAMAPYCGKLIKWPRLPKLQVLNLLMLQETTFNLGG
ncbi:hypothetical protein ADIARSV_4028 [Arcticibacter svalbardensis MN12-7]|uniref:Uncharacterized protein n=1 Tax=Arcticibacter svalbardensis MN12-7 TaxID=1150600 RepID=R9GLV6_9SPHI|nr:hypothetical protein ADIARSV_4028 [Arcticibacter svalbardensis MN12-7]